MVGPEVQSRERRAGGPRLFQLDDQRVGAIDEGDVAGEAHASAREGRVPVQDGGVGRQGVGRVLSPDLVKEHVVPAVHEGPRVEEIHGQRVGPGVRGWAGDEVDAADLPLVELPGQHLPGRGGLATASQRAEDVGPVLGLLAVLAQGPEEQPAAE
jgi:hypothetical protein